METLLGSVLCSSPGDQEKFYRWVSWMVFRSGRDAKRGNKARGRERFRAAGWDTVGARVAATALVALFGVAVFRLSPGRFQPVDNARTPAVRVSPPPPEQGRESTARPDGLNFASCFRTDSQRLEPPSITTAINSQWAATDTCPSRRRGGPSQSRKASVLP